MKLVSKYTTTVMGPSPSRLIRWESQSLATKVHGHARQSGRPRALGGERFATLRSTKRPPRLWFLEGNSGCRSRGGIVAAERNVPEGASHKTYLTRFCSGKRMTWRFCLRWPAVLGWATPQYNSMICSPPCAGLPIRRCPAGSTTKSINSKGTWPTSTGQSSGTSTTSLGQSRPWIVNRTVP